MRNTNALYILRFFAAIIVVLYHYAPGSVFQNLSFLLNNGGECVNFFFFISGFVMVIANTKYLTGSNSYFSKRDFYVKRIARIYPLYIIAILLLAFFHYFIKNIDTQTVKYRLPFELLGIQRWLYYGSFNYPGWSLSCEFFFYLLFPFVIIYMKFNKNRFKVITLTYFAISIMINYLLSYISNNYLLNALEKRFISTFQFHPVLLFSVFLFGVLCGQVYLENTIQFFKKKWNNILSVIISITLIFIIKYYATNTIILTCGILSLLYFIFITAITSSITTKKTIFDSFSFILLGEISYAIYILQYPVFTFYTHYFSKIADGYGLTIFTVVLIGIATVSHYTIEIPIRNLILNFHNKKKLHQISTTNNYI